MLESPNYQSPLSESRIEDNDQQELRTCCPYVPSGPRYAILPLPLPELGPDSVIITINDW